MLLTADSFAEAYVQGVISFIILSVIFLIASAIAKSVSKKANKKTYSESNMNETNSQHEVKMNLKIKQRALLEENRSVLIRSIERSFNYFFKDNFKKGIMRLIIAGSFLISIVVSVVIDNTSYYQREYNDGNVYEYHDDYAFVIGFVGTFISYWILYFVCVWIIKGFKEDKELLKNKSPR